MVSHPVRVRGLKRGYVRVIHLVYFVAPRAGAWIETGRRQTAGFAKPGRTPCGCVD